MRRSDKYVAMYAKGSDPLNERLTILRTKARTQILTTFLKQPIGMLGGILHSPILALAQIVGTKMGVDEYGDRSVEATMRIVAGLAGILLYYPIVATSVGLYTSSVMSGLATLPVFAISGYTFVHQSPFVTAFTTAGFTNLTAEVISSGEFKGAIQITHKLGLRGPKLSLRVFKVSPRGLKVSPRGPKVSLRGPKVIPRGPKVSPRNPKNKKIWSGMVFPRFEKI